MKPILFNTEMVKAILDGRKSVTRRVVKFNKRWTPNAPAVKAPYHPGDILYVRETFFEYKGHYYYKADEKDETLDALLSSPSLKWRPSIHMPKEAARLFLRVTRVRVERLQDINGYGVLAEGVDNGSSNPTMRKRWENMQRMAFSDLWDSTIKKADLPRYGWDANPWVWVTEFERISKEEALAVGKENS